MCRFCPAGRYGWWVRYYRMALGTFGTLRTFTWEPLLGNLFLGTFTWEPLLGNLYLGTWEPLLGNLYLGTWEPWGNRFWSCSGLLRSLYYGWRPQSILLLGKKTSKLATTNTQTLGLFPDWTLPLPLHHHLGATSFLSAWPHGKSESRNHRIVRKDDLQNTSKYNIMATRTS